MPKWQSCGRVSALLLSLLVSACDAPQAPALHINPGDTFPVLELTGLQGEAVTTAQYAGKALVVNIWATWCAPCRKELPSLDRLALALDASRYAVVGVSIDSDDHLVREFLIDRKVGFANYQDPAMRVARDVLGVRAYPSTYLVAADGRVHKVVEGAREWDSPEWVAEIRALADAFAGS